MKLSYRNGKNAEAAAKYWGKSLDKPDWYRIDAKAGDDAEIFIYDVIGWPFIEASQFVKDLSGVKAKAITVRINSPGGDVFDGTAIFNALKNHPARIVTRIEGLAASMASVIALAGDELQAHPNTMLMIHCAQALTIGNQYVHDEVKELLAKIDGNILDVYYEKSKVGKRELKEMMEKETWFTAKEARERGFIDTIVDGNAQAKAKFDLSMYAHAPDALLGAAGRESTEREKEKALRDVGFSQNEAKAILARRKGESDGDQREVESLKGCIDSIICNLTT